MNANRNQKTSIARDTSSALIRGRLSDVIHDENLDERLDR
jgi:hypothetical protein